MRTFSPSIVLPDEPYLESTFMTYDVDEWPYSVAQATQSLDTTLLLLAKY